MKKIAAMFLALALLACTLPALAEGVLTVVQENFYIVGSTTLYGYVFAKVENTGDEVVRISGGEMNILDPDGNVLATSTFPSRAAEYLQPGEYTYVSFNQRIEGVETPDQVGSYTMTLEEQHNVKGESFRLPSVSQFEDDVQEGSWTRDYLTTVVTNDADQTVFNVCISQVLLDEAGNILYYDSDSMYGFKGIPTDNSIVLRCTLGSYFEDYIEAEGLKPTTVEAIAYVNVAEAGTYTRGGAGAAEAEPEAEPKTETEPEPEAPEYATLQKGSKGSDVRALQQRLKDLGYLKGGVDGDFGKGTAGAVSAFQQKAGLEATGIADDATQKALFADDAPRA